MNRSRASLSLRDANEELGREIAERRRAERALCAARDELEARVRERTAELALANERLQGEIGERKRSEEAVRYAMERYQAIVDNVSIGIALISPDMRIVELNKTMQAWFPNVEPSERPICYRAYNSPPRDTPCAYCPTVKTLADGEVHESVTETPTPDGIKNYRITSTPIKDAAGRIAAAIEMVEDITERKQAEEALRDSETRYRALLEGVADGILIADVETKVLKYANPAMCRMLQYTDEELRTMGVADIHPKDALPGIVAKFEAQARGDMTIILDIPCLRKDGTILYADINALSVMIDGRACNVGLFRDTAERKLLDAERDRHAATLARLNGELERSNRELQEFTYAVSHDLQEPLRKVHTFAQFLVEDCGDHIPEQGKDHLRRMQDATVRMKELIHHLLELSRVEARGAEPVPTEPGQVIAGALDSLSETVRASGAEVRVRPDLPAVLADPVQLGQVFQNLVGNALKFRSPERRPAVEIAARRDGGKVVFSVSDNGIGIEERFLEKIFGVFQRLHTRDEYEGAGIGLALCKKIVQRHGGRIWATSRVGKGSTFCFTLSAPAQRQEGERDD